MLYTTRTISMTRRELKDLYFNVHMTYTNSHITMEDLGLKYGLTKQRIWQIIRFCKLGNGNYYKGLEEYNNVYKSYREEFPDANVKTLNELMRDWMSLKNIRLIKNKK